MAEYSDQVESKTAALESLQAEMTTLQEKTQAAEETAKDAENKLKSQEALLAAYKAHADGDAAGALEQLQSVDQESLSADARVLYEADIQRGWEPVRYSLFTEPDMQLMRVVTMPQRSRI